MRMIRDIAISDRDWKRRLRRSCGFLSRGSGGRDNSELLRLDDAGIERRGPGIEPFLGALASVAGVQFRALQSRQGPIEAPDAILVGELRWIESQDDATGVADPCRVFRGTGGGGDGDEQNDCRSADDQSRRAG